MYSYVDTHCDTIVKAYERGRVLEENDLHIDLKRMLNYGFPVQVFAIWLNKKCYGQAFEETDKRIDFYYSELRECNNVICHANNYKEIEQNKKTNKISGLLSIEGAEALENKIENLHYFYNKGVRAITLTWNYSNCVGNGAGVEKGGLTEFGFQVVKAMERLNMLVDVSHLNDDSFWDVARTAEKPFFASHSNCRKKTCVKRNLTDDQLKAIAEKEGMVGINLCSSFLSSRMDTVAVDNILQHIDYIGKLIGFNYIGFGFDFDGIDNPPKGINGVEDVVKVMEAIEKEFGMDITNKICEENFLNYFGRCL